MTAIAPNGSAASLAKPPTTTTRANDTLDQTSFLKLMTTQLQTQDPFDPVDNTQMVAQMAQFSQVAGVAEMNVSLKNIANDIAASRIGDMASWIGRSALVASDVVAPVGGTYAGEIALPADAAAMKLDYVDGDGNVVHSEDLGASPKGSIPFAWDGKNAAGAVVGTGPLKLVVTATSAEGAIETATAAWTTVGGVQSPAGGASKLVTPLGLLDPADTIRLA